VTDCSCRSHAPHDDPRPMRACANGHGYGRFWHEMFQSYVCPVRNCGDAISIKALYAVSFSTYNPGRSVFGR
jgi:hypothetical protein